jgi:chromosome segregation protein
MVFKKIEIYGFKSFADKLEVDFSGGITCIVGPNGCGKSNVADAIRWVLGEQSSKALRGSNMQDVIFKGTEKRGSLSYCEVSLFFDNTNHTFPVDYTEVVLSRKLYRSGESEYYINRNLARLKDITNLLHDSGIDRDGLTIISQGQVAEIINSKPESRRDIFEEAAGIAKFKARKVEAERRLERTQENLTRVTDVIKEIERSLGPLLKQALAAEKYIELKDRLKHLEINAYVHQYDNAAADKAELQAKLDDLAAQLGSHQATLQDVVEQSNNAMDEIAFLDKKAEHIREQVLGLSLSLERASGEKKLVQEKISILSAQDADVKTEVQNLTEQLEIERENLDLNKTLHAQLLERREELQKELEHAHDEYTASVEALAAAEHENYTAARDEAQAELESQINAANIERAQLLARQKTIQSLIESGEGYKFSVRRILEQSQTNSTIAKNVVGVVARLIDVPPALESAIEVALGASAQNIVTHDEDAAKALIGILQRENWGRATFLPITSVTARAVSVDEKNLLNVSGVIGIASELIKYKKDIAPVIQNLLGRVIVTEDLDVAIYVARASRYAFKIVTLDGDVIETRGSITGGSKNALNNNLWHTNTLAQIDKELAEIDKRITALADDFNRVTADVTLTRENSRNEIDQLKSTSAAAGERLTELKVRFASLDAETVNTSQKIGALVNSTLLVEKALADKRTTLHALEKHIKQTQGDNVTEREERAYREKVEQLGKAKTELELTDTKKQQIREQISMFESQRTEIGGKASEAQEKYYRLEVALSKIDIELENMQARVYEEYGLNYSSCYMFRDESFNLEQGLVEITELKKSISRLGPVNINAIEDSKDCKTRFDDYSEQVADLTSAKADLEKVIKELSAEMEAKFKADFNKINHNFSMVFRELFNGGNAKLVLTDPNDYLNSGIDIIAEPPGKKLQNITLLSGGEKALTAIAILFAILKLRPMPFCLLDEIEAALDDANVGRFAQYLQKFSKTTQFIVITHRKPTMELADNLYGVTMEEKGVSKLVSVKLAQWEETAG